MSPENPKLSKNHLLIRSWALILLSPVIGFLTVQGTSPIAFLVYLSTLLALTINVTKKGKLLDNRKKAVITVLILLSYIPVNLGFLTI